jgi:hypothetical protein
MNEINLIKLTKNNIPMKKASQPSIKGLKQIIYYLKEIEINALTSKENVFTIKEAQILNNNPEYNKSNCFPNCILTYYLVKQNKDYDSNGKKYLLNDYRNDSIKIILDILGYKLEEHFLKWLDKNPATWGNRFGSKIFDTHLAFESYDLSGHIVNNGSEFKHIRSKFERLLAILTKKKEIEYFHRTKEGNNIRLKDLTDNHLLHIIKFNEKIAKEGIIISYNSYDVNNNYFRDEEVLDYDQSLAKLNQNLYIQELIRRNLL